MYWIYNKGNIKLYIIKMWFTPHLDSCYSSQQICDAQQEATTKTSEGRNGNGLMYICVYCDIVYHGQNNLTVPSHFVLSGTKFLIKLNTELFKLQASVTISPQLSTSKLMDWWRNRMSVPPSPWVHASKFKRIGTVFLIPVNLCQGIPTITWQAIYYSYYY